MKGDGGDPPAEDKEGKTNEGHDTDEEMEAGGLAPIVDDVFLCVSAEKGLLLVVDRSRMGLEDGLGG